MKPSLSIDGKPTSFQFLQNSSLLTALPQLPGERSIPLPVLLPPQQQTTFPTQPVLAQLDAQGGIRIDLSVPASALVLGRLLGKGGFGAVYEGVYQGKSVAIKQLTGHLSADTLTELKREAEIMFQLGISSEHVVKLIKICLETPYSLVMELMPQGSLYDLLRNGQNLPWGTRYQIAADTAQGLSDLHERKILHRDLKSLNILLRNGRAKLADFGLAKVKHETSSQLSTAKGTVLWMAPELFDDEPKTTEASDIYSFGMVLWELVTRRLPYDKWRPEVAGIRITQKKQEEIPSDCPVELKAIIESCWDLTPAKRPTAIRVLENLKSLVELKAPPLNDPALEIKKSKAQMEQMQLMHERQLREEKQRLVAKKQQLEAEIGQPKQRNQPHQLESKHLPDENDLKPISQTIATPMKPALIPTLSQLNEDIAAIRKMKFLDVEAFRKLISNTFLFLICNTEWEEYEQEISTKWATVSMLYRKVKKFRTVTIEEFPVLTELIETEIKHKAPRREPAASTEQLELQDELVTACEQGDLKAVQALFKTTFFRKVTAKPNVANTVGKQPLGAAIWSMNPDIVNELLKQADGIAPKSWKRWEKHNLEHYKEVFIVPQFNPQTYNIWHHYLQKIDSNPFIRAFHLKKVNERQLNKYPSWEHFKKYIQKMEQSSKEIIIDHDEKAVLETEVGYADFRIQIEQKVKNSWLPTAIGRQFYLQKLLIEICKEWDDDETAVMTLLQLLQRNVIPDTGNWNGEQPLGAAVWSMHPNMVDALLKQAEGVAPMTWDGCIKHNLEHYGKVFKVKHNSYVKGQIQKAIETASCPRHELQVKIVTEEKQLEESKLKQSLLQTIDNRPLKFASISSSAQSGPISKIEPMKVSPEQLKLQNELVIACEHGDLKAVQALFKVTFSRKITADPELANTVGKQPLGAAVWGMNPNVVKELLKQTDVVAPMTWRECEEHNRKYYGEVFILSTFKLEAQAAHRDSYYCKWFWFLETMNANLFIRAYHLKEADAFWHCDNTNSWTKFMLAVQSGNGRICNNFNHFQKVVDATEQKYVGLRAEIMKEVTIMSQIIPQTLTIFAPRLFASVKQLQLQNQLIEACEQGDEKSVTALLKRGGKPNMPNAKSKQPLGAAIWGMCPDVINALLKQTGNVTPMTWEECKKHNLEHYHDTFVIPEFNPKKYDEWQELLSKMNPFVKAYYLYQIDGLQLEIFKKNSEQS